VKGDCAPSRMSTLGGDGGGLDVHNFYVPGRRRRAGPRDQCQVRAQARLRRRDDGVVRRPRSSRRRAARSWSAISTSRRSSTTSGATRRCSRSSATRRSRSRSCNRAQAAGPWVDALRKFVPDDQKLYTWWSYRSPDWAAADKGRRLDHVWVSPALAERGRVDARHARRARLGAPVRPCAGHGAMWPCRPDQADFESRTARSPREAKWRGA
jgi:exodeoxyribonuclease-3